MIKNSGIVTIGHAQIDSGHLYHFTDSLSSYWCVYVDAYSKRGIIKRSRDQGLSWYITDDVGPVDEIRVRGRYAAYRRGAKVSIYDLDEGFVVFERSYEVFNATGGRAIGTNVIPVPEMGGFAMVPASLSSGTHVHALFSIKNGAQFGGVGGNNGLRALWGTQNNDMKNPDPAVDKIFWVASYQDPSDPQITYDYLSDSQFGEVLRRTPVNSRYPTELPLAHTFGYDRYQGFLSSRNELYGVGCQTTVSNPAFFLPPDNWQRGVNTAPLYVASLAVPSRTDGVTTFPVLSTPSGVQYDDLSSRSAVIGNSAGARRVGLIEPGGGLAHCVVQGLGQFGGRKFLGNMPGVVSRIHCWMPFSNGIFGMGFIGSVSGTTKGGTATLMWVYDKEPDVVPARAVSVDGKFEVLDQQVGTRSAKVGSRKYDRW